MLRKSTMLALAAVAALALTVSNASAGPGKPGINGINGPGMGNPGINIKPIGGKPGVNWPGLKPKYPKPILRPIVKPIVTPVPVIVSRPVVVGGPTYVVSRPVVSRPGPCTCLSKEYTPQGAVLFKDRCTNEMATNPPLQQQGAMEAPQQSAQYQR